MALQIIAFIIGWLTGIVVNYLADVLPSKRGPARPACTHCGADFQAVDYIFYRRCRTCGKRRPLRGGFVEVGMAIAGTLIVGYPIHGLGIWISLILFGFFVLVTVIDIEHRLILHVVSLGGAILCFGVGWRLHGLAATVFGGTAGLLLMLAMYFLGFVFLRLSRKMRGQELTESEAIGFGDVNLSAIIGLALGWPGIIAGLVLAILLAGAASLVYLLWMIARRGYSPNLALPYGPFLAASAVILLYLRPLLMK